MKIKNILLGAIVSLTGSLVWAGSFPPPQDKIVNDYAQVLSAERTIELKEILSRVERQTGVQISLLVIPSLPGHKSASAAIEPLAQGIFNEWGVGRKDTNNGVLILVSIKEKLVRFQFGKDYSEADANNLKETFQSKILPYFRQGNASEALFASAMYTVQGVTDPVSFWEFHRTAILLGILGLISLGGCLVSYAKKNRDLTWATFILTGVFLLFLTLNLRLSRESLKLGGGSSAGVGVTEHWS